MRTAPALQRLGIEELAVAVPGVVRQKARKRWGAVALGGGHRNSPKDDDNDNGVMV